MLYINDKQMYKLREIRNIEGETLDTFRYEIDGRIIQSSRKHNKGQVKGIVKYKVS